MSMQYETKLWKTKPSKHLYEDPVYLLKVLKFAQRKFCKKKDIDKIDAKNAVLRRKIFFFNLSFTQQKVKKPLHDMELQEKDF